MLELRPEVAAFAQALEAQLRANDHKSGWKGDSVSSLMERLKEEVDELVKALCSHLIEYGRAKRGTEEPLLFADTEFEVLKEAADVANFAMMIADVCGGLVCVEADDSKPSQLCICGKGYDTDGDGDCPECAIPAKRS